MAGDAADRPVARRVYRAPAVRRLTEDAVADAGFVQENGPERLDIKRDLFRRLDEAAPPDALLATSTSCGSISWGHVS